MKESFSLIPNRPPYLDAMHTIMGFPSWMGALGLPTVSLGEQVAPDGFQSIFSGCKLRVQLQGGFVPAHCFFKLLLLARNASTVPVCRRHSGKIYQTAVRLERAVVKKKKKSEAEATELPWLNRCWPE